jgi:hypothetical protein
MNYVIIGLKEQLSNSHSLHPTYIRLVDRMASTTHGLRHASVLRAQAVFTRQLPTVCILFYW